ncbi:MAG TPA: TetR/AcrR family transcriptional regulator [Chthoniobacterales bacterium]
MSVTPPVSSERRERLLDTAAKLFARWGFDKTSVDDIARETGVSKGAVYLDFPGKNALFTALLHREFARHAAEWLRRFEQDHGDWSFARMIQHSLAAVNTNPFVKAIMTRDKRLLGSFLQRDTELLKNTISARAELFARLQEVGAIRDDISAQTLAFLTTSISFGLISSDDFIPGEHKIPFDDGVQALGLLLDRGLAPATPGNREAARNIIIEITEKMRAALHDPS